MISFQYKTSYISPTNPLLPIKTGLDPGGIEDVGFALVVTS